MLLPSTRYVPETTTAIETRASTGIFLLQAAPEREDSRNYQCNREMPTPAPDQEGFDITPRYSHRNRKTLDEQVCRPGIGRF
jgi:hypothetical protein